MANVHSGIFKRTKFYEKLCECNLNLPQDKPLPGSSTTTTVKWGV